MTESQMDQEQHGLPASAAAVVLDRLRGAGMTVAVAESLTGGLVLAALTEVPGASQCVRGGVVSYHADLKRDLLAVDPDVIREQGVVNRRVAEQMAAGVAELCGSDVGLATTGVAGPGPSGGVPAGTFWVSGWTATATFAREHRFPGARHEIRTAARTAALELLIEIVPRAA